MKSSVVLHSCILVIVVCIVAGCKKEKATAPSGPPSITDVSNSVAGIGYQIIITGNNFSQNAASNTVTINGTTGTVISASSTQLSVIFTNAVTGKISVEVNGNSTTSANAIRIINLSVTTLAGSGIAGSTDGTGTAASFNQQWGCTVDANGNVFVADSYNNKIRKIAPDGTVTTVAGTGTQGNKDGLSESATFSLPFGIVVDKDDNIYVSDLGFDNIRKITPAGIVSTFAGSPTGQIGSADGADTSATFQDPLGLATDADGNIYVSDAANNRIRKITSGGIVTTIA
jgi:IPT/TIG domain/NHL repeat